MEKEKNKVEKELEILRKANDLLTQENYTHMEVNMQLRQEIKLLNEEENKQEKFESSSLCPMIISKDASTTTCDLSNSDNNSDLEVLTEIQVLRNANITLKARGGVNQFLGAQKQLGLILKCFTTRCQRFLPFVKIFDGAQDMFRQS